MIFCFFINQINMSLNKPIWKIIDWIDIEKLRINLLSLNPNAIEYLEEFDNKKVWYYLSGEEKSNKIIWEYLSLNPYAINLLERNPEKINWKHLSYNENAIHLLEKNPEKIDWDNLSRNKNAIHLLKKNPEKIDWYNICYNPSIYKLDYEQMRINNQSMYEELIKEVMKPSRVFKNPDYDYLEELFGD